MQSRNGQSPPISVHSHHSELSDLEHGGVVSDGSSSSNSDTSDSEYSSGTSADHDDVEADDESGSVSSSRSSRSSHVTASSTQVRKITIPKRVQQRVQQRGSGTEGQTKIELPKSAVSHAASRDLAKPVQVKVDKSVVVKPRIIPPPSIKRTMPPDIKLQARIQKHKQSRPSVRRNQFPSSSYLSPVTDNSEPNTSDSGSYEDDDEESHDYDEEDDSNGDSNSDVASTITALSAAAGSAAALASLPKKQRKKVASTLGLVIGTVAVVGVLYIAYRMWNKMHGMKAQIEKLQCEIESNAAASNGHDLDQEDIERIARNQIQKMLDEPPANSQPVLPPPAALPLQTPPEFMNPNGLQSSTTGSGVTPVTLTDLSDLEKATASSPIIISEQTPLSEPQQQPVPVHTILPVLQAPSEVLTTPHVLQPIRDNIVHIIRNEEAAAGNTSADEEESHDDVVPEDMSKVERLEKDLQITLAGQEGLKLPAIDDVITANLQSETVNTASTSAPDEPSTEVPEKKTVVSVANARKAAKPRSRKVPVVTLKSDNTVTELGSKLQDEKQEQVATVPEQKPLSDILSEQAS